MSKEYKSIKDVANEWKISTRRVQILCTNGRIPGAIKDGRVWKIPADAEKPDDNRVKEGEEHPQYFSGMRRSSYNFLDAYISEVGVDIRSVLDYGYLLKEIEFENEKVSQYVFNMSVAAVRVLEATTELSKLIDLDRGKSDSSVSVVPLAKALDRFLIYARNTFKENHIQCVTNGSLSAGYAFTDIELNHTLHRSVIVNVCRLVPRGGKVTIDVTNTEDDEYYYVKFLIEGDFDFNIMTKKQRYIRDAFIMNVISSINGDNETQKLEDIETPNGYSYVLRYKKASSSEYNDTVERYWDDEKNAQGLQQLAGIKVLLADTNTITRDAHADMLRNYGMEIECLDSGIQLLSKLEQAPSNYYNLIMVDANMPNVDGLVVTKAIRHFKDSSKAGLPIISITNAYDENDDAIYASGADMIIKRPADQVTILRAIYDAVFDRNK